MKILHTADFHLDSPFEGFENSNAVTRRQEQRKLLSFIAETAEIEKVDVVLLCGDILDSESYYYETGEELVKVLKEFKVPTFIAPGNHDFYSDKSPYAKLNFSDNVCIFTKDELEYVELDYLNLRVYGAAYIDKEEPDFLSGFKAKKDGYINIMCLHGMPKADHIANSNLDYLALGHIHKGSGLKKAGSTYYSYPGCPMGRGFDETGDKTLSIVSINGNECEIKEIAVPGRKYEILKVKIEDGDPLTAIESNIPLNCKEDIYRIILSGETEEKIDVDSIYEKISKSFYHLQIIDNTRIRTKTWDKMGEDTLRGLFLKKLKNQYDQSKTSEERKMIEQAAKWGIAALDNMEEISVHENK